METIEKGSSTSCFITQVGKDGFGHQLEGKLSCIALGIILPQRFTYIHTSFEKFEHSKMPSSVANTFVNLEAGNYSATNETFLQGMKRSKKVVNADLLRTWITAAAFSNPGICDSNVLYRIDNCWDIVYKEPFASQMVSPAITGFLRSIYLGSPKPEVGFHSRNISFSTVYASFSISTGNTEHPLATKQRARRANVVVHIRRGDAGERILDEMYFAKAISYYNKTLAIPVGDHKVLYPVFWIESDDPKWEPIQRWVASNPDDFQLPNATDTLLTVFHRFVMADGFVMSYSSLSCAAALLSDAKVPIVVAGDLCYGSDPNLLLRKELFRTSKFIALNKTTTAATFKL